MIYTEEGPNIIEGTWFGEWENIARVAKSANVSIFERKGYIFISFKSFLIRRDHCLQCYNVEIGGAEKQVHVKPAPAGQHRMQTSSICTSVNWSVFSCLDLYFLLIDQYFPTSWSLINVDLLCPTHKRLSSPMQINIAWSVNVLGSTKTQTIPSYNPNHSKFDFGSSEFGQRSKNIAPNIAENRQKGRKKVVNVPKFGLYSWRLWTLCDGHF